jgi:hypothetical protein
MKSTITGEPPETQGVDMRGMGVLPDAGEDMAADAMSSSMVLGERHWLRHAARGVYRVAVAARTIGTSGSQSSALSGPQSLMLTEASGPHYL